MRAAADRREIGVAGEQAHPRDVHREPFGDELGKARFVALSGGQRSEHDFDPSFGQHADLGALARRSGVELDVMPRPMPRQRPRAPRFFSSFLETFHSASSHPRLYPEVVATVVTTPADFS